MEAVVASSLYSLTLPCIKCLSFTRKFHLIEQDKKTQEVLDPPLQWAEQTFGSVKLKERRRTKHAAWAVSLLKSVAGKLLKGAHSAEQGHHARWEWSALKTYSETGERQAPAGNASPSQGAFFLMKEGVFVSKGGELAFPLWLVLLILPLSSQMISRVDHRRHKRWQSHLFCQG